MQYFDISTIKSAIKSLQVISPNWLIPPFVFAANDVGIKDFVNLSKKKGTDQFLDRYFNGRLIGLPDFPTGNNLLRPRLRGVKWIGDDYVIRQDTKMWGNLFSSRGYREMRQRGELEGEKATMRLTDSFQPKFEAQIPDTFQFEDFLVWLLAFNGFNDGIKSWQELYNYFLKEHLELQEFQEPFGVAP